MKNIALSFSGGGFRAAAYSLGCLSYLGHLKYNGKPLLENVTFISSTSGGSITNLVYSHHIYSGRSLAQCYNFLKSQLEGDALLSEALLVLGTTGRWKDRPEKSRNLINAFALAYEKLFDGENFAIFSNRSQQPHLEEICINATEFTNGLAFRFQSQHPDISNGEIGNGYISFKSAGLAAAKAIKLSDILASSSCFPSGFEPLIFPRDYANKNVSAKELIQNISYKANEYTLDKYNHISFLTDNNFDKEVEFGLMDGGIADNQAIDAFMHADERRKKTTPFDLYISCDVTSHLMDGYTLPVQKKHIFDFISIGAVVILLACVILWLPAMYFALPGPWQPWQYITGTLSSLPWCIAILYFVPKLWAPKVKKVNSTWGVTFKKHLGKFAVISVGGFRQMLAARIKSVFILSNDIYLKQIRRQYYDAIFSDAKYRDRSIQNTIYDLSRAKFSPDDLSDHPLHPSRAVIEMAEKARTMGTTLWFDAHHQKYSIKEAIIATGQFTTCYNLIRFLEKKKDFWSDEERILHQTLMEDWSKFCTTPDFLV